VPASRLSLAEVQLPAGGYLRELRLRLGLGLRDVQDASAILAAEENNEELYISSAWLGQIEMESSVPSIFKILSLSTIYGIDFLYLLRRYGVRPDRFHKYRKKISRAFTHPVSSTIYEPDTTVTLPMRIDPRFHWETTQLLNRVVAIWGEIPAAMLTHFNPREHIYAYVGLEDYTMFPLIRPGALVMVDDKRNHIVQDGWKNEYERPIYFIEMRDGYRVSWCEVKGGKLTLVPHPVSPVRTQTINFPGDAEVVGQVVGVAMRVVPGSQTTQES
jgi:transcriptional regulator with XRE-family HTH domain